MAAKKRPRTQASAPPPRRGASSRGGGGEVSLSALQDALAVGDLLDALSARETFDRLLDRLLECAVRAIGTEEGSITELDPKQNELRFRTAHSLAKAKLQKLRMPISSGVLGYVARSGQTLCVADVTTDQRFDRTVDEAVGFTTRSLVAAPIRDGDTVLGVLELVNLVGDAEVTSEDLAVLGSFADAIATVLQLERGRRGSLAFVERALREAGKLTPGSTRDNAREILKHLRAYRTAPGYRRSVELAVLIREVCAHGEDAAGFVHATLAAYRGTLEGR